MKKGLAVAALILVLAAVASAQMGLGITLGKDYVYYEGETPFKVGGFFNIPLGETFKLGIRGGFATLTTMYEEDYEDPNDPEYDYYLYSKGIISGMEFELRGLAEVPINSDLASLYGGLGLGYYSRSLKSEDHYEDADTSFTRESEDVNKLSGFGQTFIAGCHLGVSESFGFNIEIEGLGFSLMNSMEEAEEDDDGDDQDETTTETRKYTLMPGFNDIGISVAAVFRF